MFRQLDRDGSGALSPAELTCRLSDYGFSDHDVMTIFLNLDANSDGLIDLEEFIGGFPVLMQAAEGGPVHHPAPTRKAQVTGALLQSINDVLYRKWSTLKEAFRHLDDDHNQNISPQEFVAKLQQFNFNLSPEETGALISYFDRNGDGKISYLEFVNVLEGNTPPDEVVQPGGRGGSRGARGYSTTNSD